MRLTAGFSRLVMRTQRALSFRLDLCTHVGQRREIERNRLPVDTEERRRQTNRTRNILDDVSNGLTTYDIATCWMNATGPGRALKLALDIAAAGAAMSTVEATMGVLIAESLFNANKIRAELGNYETAAKDTTGDPSSCEVFPIPDAGQLPGLDERQRSRLPDPNKGTTAPSRSKPGTPYTVPSPEEPIEYGPPATPLGVPSPAASAGITGGRAPVSTPVDEPIRATPSQT